MARNEREQAETDKAPAILEGPIALLPDNVRKRLGIVKTDQGWEIPVKWMYAMLSIIPKEKLGTPIEQKKGSQHEAKKTIKPTAII